MIPLLSQSPKYVSLVILLRSFILFAQPIVSDSPGWDAFPLLLQKISPPSFPQKVFDITRFGAVGNDKTDCTGAFRKAIEKCSASGGGIVLVPGGSFLTASLHLKNNVNLHLSKNAVVRFLTNPQNYLPLVYTRWEGVECMNYSPLIYAYRQENIAITGEGVLDGQGAKNTWWSWKGSKEGGWVMGMPNQIAARKKLFEMGETDVPLAERIFGDGFYLRPNFFEPYECKNVLVQGVKFKNSPMWFLNPILCTNVSIIGVTVEGLGPNNDGCDPESCTDVLVKNCFFDTGDDCIAIKSGRNNDGRRVNVPCSNIIIQGCRMKNGHGGISIGSELSGGICNVYAENDTMDNQALVCMLRIKTNSVRGGVVKNVFLRNIKVGNIADAVMRIDYYYEEGDVGSFTPLVQNVELKNIESDMSKFGIWIRAYDRSQATKIHIENCTFNNVAEPNILENVKDLSMINVKIIHK
jgi:polygalacturonase